LKVVCRISAIHLGLLLGSPQGGLLRFLFARAQTTVQCSLVLVAALTVISSIGCGSPASSIMPGAQTGSPSANSPSAQALKESSDPPVLLFNGTGTSASDVVAVEAILATQKLSYATADTSQIEAMSESQLAAYKLLIVPGGNSITIGDNLSKNATSNIHNAVINDGLHYLGICAGAFFGGYSEYNGLNLTSGVWFNTYANGGHGTGKTAVELSFPNDTEMDMYWQDGPELDGWGEIISKYPDGTSSMVEGSSGKGWVILSGVHAEAPASWREGMNFTTSLQADLAYAGTLVNAALNGTTLKHY
jgi:Biotin-protein ligase, N terminal